MPDAVVKRRRTLVVIDDDRLLCRAVKDRLGSESLAVIMAHTAAEGLGACSAGAADVIVLDQKLPDGEGYSLCQPILETNGAAKIIFVTGYPSFDNAVRALKAGAHDYLCKPFELEELALVVQRCLSLLDLEKAERLADYRSAKDGEDSVLVGGPALDAIREVLALASSSEAPALITGETGTGKNLAARSIHFGGRRRQGPFISVNCAALPENLIEAELFGWERGAFTGAAASREGVVEMAEGGTLFLDEIGEMPVHLQAKLLSLIEEKEVRRVGGRTARPVDARIVAATNADLESRVAARQFRADLYYRLDVLRLHVPPLRERKGDIPVLCEHLLQRMVGRGRRPDLAPGEPERLAAYPWPGNVRELRNVLERSLVLHRDPLRPSELLAEAREAGGTEGTPAQLGLGELALEGIERRHIEKVLLLQAGNLSRTAKLLGISLSTLKRKVKRYRIGHSGPNPAGANHPI